MSALPTAATSARSCSAGATDQEQADAGRDDRVTQIVEASDAHAYGGNGGFTAFRISSDFASQYRSRAPRSSVVAFTQTVGGDPPV